MERRSLYFLVGVVVILALIALSYIAARQAPTAPTAAPAPSTQTGQATVKPTGAQTPTATETATATGTATGTPAQTQAATATQAAGTATGTAAATASPAPAETVTATQKATETAAAERRVLRVYVYKDFMAWGEVPDLFQKLVKRFENETGIRVEVRLFDGARAAVTTAIREAEEGKPTADIIIGVDEITIQELKKHGLLQCYLSPEASEKLANALDPDNCVTPVDYGVIALVYDPKRLNATELEMLSDGVTLDELVKLAPRLVVEDPTRSSTGLNFLLYTIAVSKAEGRDWRQLWEELKTHGVLVAKSWGAAWDEFSRKGSSRAIMVSYGTDPAYSAWYNAKHGKPMKPDINATVLKIGEKPIAWLQIEGVAILKGAPTKEAREFVDWLLSPAVQKEIPSSQWMLPANPHVELPPYYRYALTLDKVGLAANPLLPPSMVASELEKWLADWLRIMSG